MVMNRALSIVAVMLCISGPFSAELQRLPALVQHYGHHVTAHGEASLSFLDFALDHLGDHDDHDSEHQDLPFHSLAGGPGTTAVVPVQTSIEPSVILSTPAAAIAAMDTPQEPPTGSVFQPPRA